MMCLEQGTGAADAYLACLRLVKETLTAIQHVLHNLLAKCILLVSLMSSSCSEYVDLLHLDDHSKGLKLRG